MKEKTFYREKAERIKDTILISKETPMGDIIEPSDIIKPYPGLHDSLMEFIHLVYSFDPNLPLNKEIGPLLDKEACSCLRDRPNGILFRPALLCRFLHSLS